MYIEQSEIDSFALEFMDDVVYFRVCIASLLLRFY